MNGSNDVSTGPLPVLSLAEAVLDLPPGIRGWTTTRANGSFGLGSDEPVHIVMSRWHALQADLATFGVNRLATSHQVHAAALTTHGGGWDGWLRGHGVDGHVTTVPGTALAVTVADCTPVLVAHPGGAAAMLHAGWRGTAAGILPAGIARLAELGFAANECRVHLGPSICGKCYEVGPEVLEAIHGTSNGQKGYLDVRAVLFQQAREQGVRNITIDEGCTRCHAARYFSHRGGDSGRLLGLVTVESS
ncbi:MAG: polyphenol oxidase family protein [Gemmatimonadaceae bacterium]|nr:polyphenol oxidase family protein [Gemmatimonadaceae bacterium]